MENFNAAKMAFLIVMTVVLFSRARLAFSLDRNEADSGGLSELNDESPKTPFVCARSKDWDDSADGCADHASIPAGLAGKIPSKLPLKIDGKSLGEFPFDRVEGPDSDGIYRVVYRNGNFPKGYFDREGDDDSESA